MTDETAIASFSGRGQPAAPFVIAHRGSSGRAPENTIVAFDLALEKDGAEGLELDVHATRDGVPVVIHDPLLCRTTDGFGFVVDHDLDDILRLDAGYRFGEGTERPFRGRGIAVPTLEDVFERYPDTWLSIDLKEGDPYLERAVLSLVERFDARERVVVSAESPRSARRIARMDPGIERFFDRRAALHFYLRHRSRIWWGYRAPARSLQIPVEHDGRRLDTEELIADAHRLGLAVRYWTVNDESTMERLIDIGADGIITDHPARLREVLASKGRR